MQDRRARLGRRPADLCHRFREGGAIDPGRPRTAHKRVIDEMPPPVSGEESDVRQLDDGRFTGHLVMPSPSGHDCALLL
jgi:hypothetical protein